LVVAFLVARSYRYFDNVTIEPSFMQMGLQYIKKKELFPEN